MTVPQRVILLSRRSRRIHGLDEMIEVLASPSATYPCAWYLRRLHVCEERTYTEQDVADGLWKTYRLINGDSAR